MFQQRPCGPNDKKIRSLGQEQNTGESEPMKHRRFAVVSTISIDELSGFENYPKQIQSLVQSALALTRLELSYIYGSHEPNKGGMDCSGTVYHVLQLPRTERMCRASQTRCATGWKRRRSFI
jgi:hypothetical protein